MPACPSSVPYLGRTSSIRYASSWRRSPRSRFAIRNLKPSGLRRSTPALLFQQRQGHSGRRRRGGYVAPTLPATRRLLRKQSGRYGDQTVDLRDLFDNSIILFNSLYGLIGGESVSVR